MRDMAGRLAGKAGRENRKLALPFRRRRDALQVIERIDAGVVAVGPDGVQRISSCRKKSWPELKGQKDEMVLRSRFM
jgi:hypothetical protein